AQVAPVLRAMEEAGKVRRGYFVEGLGGAQFAHPGAVDRLRAGRDENEAAFMTLAAIDPANPYGSLLPWPDSTARGPGAPDAPGTAANNTSDGRDGDAAAK